MSRRPRPALAAAIGAAVGGAGGLVGLGGAEFRLPVLVGALGFTARQAVPVNLLCSFVVLAAALPFRTRTVPFEALGPYWPAILGMLAGSMSAAWAGAGWLKRIGDNRLNLAILVLLVLLGLTLIAEALFVVTPVRLVPDHIAPTVLAAAAAGIAVGLVVAPRCGRRRADHPGLHPALRRRREACRLHVDADRDADHRRRPRAAFRGGSDPARPRHLESDGATHGRCLDPRRDPRRARARRHPPAGPQARARGDPDLVSVCRLSPRRRIAERTV